MGLYEISFLVGLVVGNVLGGQLWGLVGTGGFYVLAALYVATAAILYFFVPESLPAEAKERHLRDREHAATSAHPVLTLFATRLKAYRKLLGEAALRSFVPAWLAVNAVVGLWAIHIQPTMIRGKDTDRFPKQLLDGKFTASEVGLWVGAFGLCFMVGIWGWSLLYSKMRKSDMMLIAIGGLFLTCVAFWGINSGALPLPGEWREWAWVPVLAIGVLLQSGFTPVALAYLAEISGTRVEHRGAVMGLYSVFLGVGQLVGAGLGGVFLTAVDLGFNGIIIGTALLGIVALVTVIHLRRAYEV
jgi:predicted MFS family arabinose efflux permease